MALEIIRAWNYFSHCCSQTCRSRIWNLTCAQNGHQDIALHSFHLIGQLIYMPAYIEFGSITRLERSTQLASQRFAGAGVSLGPASAAVGAMCIHVQCQDGWHGISSCVTAAERLCI